MSFVDKKTLDIVLEDNSDFGFLLTLQQVTEECDTHPVSGEPINCVEVSTPLDISNITFQGSISKSLVEGTPSLLSFTFSNLNNVEGVASMTLSAAQVKAVVTEAEDTRDKYNPRYRFLGYYDVLAEDTQTGIITRIMQGKVYISDGVTD